MSEEAPKPFPAPPLPVKRLPNGHFVKGQSGNPSGRGQYIGKFVKFLREQTHDGRECAEFALHVMRGDLPGFRGSDRMAAHEWISTFIFGKPTQYVDVTTRADGDPVSRAVPINPSKLTEEELRMWRVLVAKAAADEPVIDVTPEPAQSQEGADAAE